jgi:diguanylate cyclase (GGDEF)-like protein/PAS domain S-box-containing protein
MESAERAATRVAEQGNGASGPHERLARLAARLLSTPAAAVLVQDGERVLVGATWGAPAALRTGATPAGTFAPLAAGVPLVIDHAPAGPEGDALRADGVTAILGIPLALPGRNALIGACVWDIQPRRWGSDEIALLQDLLAAIATDPIRAIRATSSDARLHDPAIRLELYASILARADEAVAVIDEAGCYLEQNDQHRWLLGFADGDLRGRTPALHMGDAAFARLLEGIRGSGEFRGDVRSRAQDGTLIDLDVTAFPITDAAARTLCIVTIQRDITIRKRAEDAARTLAGERAARAQAEEEHRRVATILESITDGFVALDRDWRFTYVNREAERLLERERDQLLGSCIWEAMPETVGSEFERQYRLALKERRPVAFEALSTQVRRWFDVRAFPSASGLSVYFRDVTQRRAAQNALLVSESRYRSIFEDARDAIYVTTREGEFVDVNSSALELFGYDRDELIGMNAGALYAGQGGRLKFQEVIEQTGYVRDFEVRLQRKDGAVLDCLLTSSVRRDEEGQVAGYQGIIHDITERKRTEAQLLHEALHDALTGLPNRTLFMDRLSRSLERARRNRSFLFAVLFLDLDRFKVINDSLGHLVGDEVLAAIAHRLVGSVRPGDTVARLGGDEFAVLLYNIENLTDATTIADRIQDTLRQPLTIRGREVFTTASVGIALSSTECERAEDLLRDADTAMYRAKELGRVRHQVFDRTMHTRAVELLQLETDLRRAVDRMEFTVHYQPIVSLATRELEGFEALARWNHPERGLVLPADFIPLAEETGLIVPIGYHVLLEACRTMGRWQAAYPRARGLSLSVNLSGRQLAQPDLVDKVRAALAAGGLPPGALKLEITESAIMVDPENAVSVFGEMRDLGIELCIDDFGTGYSSLAYLQRFPVTRLKIDRAFVRCLLEESSNVEIVRAIVTLAQNLGIEPIAEGVETPEQQTRLLDLGSRFAQGFLFSTAVSADEAELLLPR